MKYVVFTGGTFTPSRYTQQALEQADVIIAADSGANTALELGIIPSVVLGDMDSIDEQTRTTLEGKSTQFIVSSSEKDETDTELALDYAIKQAATKITVLGGTAGDRIDHILANLLLLTQSNVHIEFINGLQKTWLAKGPIEEIIYGEKGDLLSLIPLVLDVTDITTQHLYYPLKNETLLFGKPRGVSNVFTDNTVTVSFQEGILLFVYTSHDEGA